MYSKLITNHALTNLTFGLVLLIGAVAYLQMPREQGPNVNFNWIQVLTFWPGAAATDVEKQVTQPLEDGIEGIADIWYESSSSREGASTIIVGFKQLGDERFRDRANDLRREIQSRLAELPQEATQPQIVEMTDASAFPTVALVVAGVADDETLRKAAIDTRKDLARMSGVDRVDAVGDTNPEIQVQFSPQRLVGLGISPVDLADTVKAYFRDLAAGNIDLGDESWFVRLVGTSSDPEYLEALPVITAAGELPLRSIGDVVYESERPSELVMFKNRPAVLLTVFKEENANVLALVEQVRSFIGERNRVLQRLGVQLILLDDQTQATRQAIGVMESNAAVGLACVMFVVWLFLGFRSALFTTLGIPFALAGTFALAAAFGQTLNTAILLGVVIALGMLVDDSIVVAEAVHDKLRKGYQGLEAAMAALREVAAPVATSVLTTIAAFLPLMLMPGILGQYMRIVPAVVTIALLVSLVEAFWMLPSHLLGVRAQPWSSSRAQRIREAATQALRRRYVRVLVAFLRFPRLGIMAGVALIVGAVVAVGTGLIKVDYFASDLVRLFYVDVTMPPGTRLEKTLQVLQQLEAKVRSGLKRDETRAVVSYAGEQFTDSGPLFGEENGQIFVSLEPDAPGRRGVDEVIDGLREAIRSVPGPLQVSFVRRKVGPPAGKPLVVKVRGDDLQRIRLAAQGIQSFLRAVPGVVDVKDNDTKGRMELNVQLKPDAIVRSGLNPADVIRAVRLYADGEVVASMRHLGEKLSVRVKAEHSSVFVDPSSFLSYTLGLRDGSEITLGELLHQQVLRTTANIRHSDFRRSISVEADIDAGETDTITVNKAVRSYWDENASKFPGVSVTLRGQIEDIRESLDAMFVLFLIGGGLIYLILAAQFASYKQPLMVVMVVPLAFVGVAAGLFSTGNPLSLYTLYGVVALAGISANDAIVLVTAANQRLDKGASVGSAIISAAGRRVIPIIMTSVTTMAGLFSLATGFAGKSLMWGPMATAIVWGLGFCTVFTLFFIPLAYVLTTKPLATSMGIPLPPVLSDRAYPWLHNLRSQLTGRPGREHIDTRVIADEEEKERYKSAVAAMGSGDLESAIKSFQWLADKDPKCKLYNSCVVQALLLYVHRNGWDDGYMARAHRYLSRARLIDKGDNRLRQLERIYRELERAASEK